ncbi:MAG: TOBE domain-containing protein, partial [Chloroflexi bacterium]|nr:TOBE domain-containing protein [Chloroflexota bacterium]
CRVQGGARQAGPGEMAVNGVLAGEEIIGSIFTYNVQLGSGNGMWVEQHESLSDQVPELDSPVTVWWPVAETVVLSE